MSQFINNFFIPNRGDRTLGSPRNSNGLKSLPTKDVKKVTCLYLSKIIQKHLNKRISLGMGKIMMQSATKQNKNNYFIQVNQSRFSTQTNTPLSTPKNSFKIPKNQNPVDNFLTVGRLLKKRSSLNQTRPTSSSKSKQNNDQVANPERTYVQPNQLLINKQLSNFKMMELSGQVRQILQKIHKFDKGNFAFQLQKICKDIFVAEVRKLQKIKNSSKQTRSLVFDNELTMTAMCNNVKMISDLNKQVMNLRRANQQMEKQLKKRRNDHERQYKSSQKLQKHMMNIQNQMKVYMERIEQNLQRRDPHKALIGINQFIKKYQNQSYAKQRIYFYSLIKDRIIEHKEVQKCLDEICRILGVLCIADLTQTEACLRSFKANSTSFKYLKNTQGNVDRQYGKQMKNILHNLQNFNNKVVQYLEIIKQLQKQKNKPTGKEELQKQFQQTTNQLNQQLEQQKKKYVLLQIQMQKLKYKLQNLDPVTENVDYTKKLQLQFENKMKKIIQKINMKKDYKKQLDNLKKDPLLSVNKPYSLFNVLLDTLIAKNEEKIKAQIEQISKTFTEVSKIFRQQQMQQQNRFKQINKIIDSSSKNNTFFFDLHRFLQSLMFTIVRKTKDESQIKKLKRLQEQKFTLTTDLKQERKRARRLSEQIDAISFDFTSVVGKSCRSKLGSPPKSIVYFNAQQNNINQSTLNEKEAIRNMELFLNKVSPILHKPEVKMDAKLVQIQQLSQLLSINNPKFEKIYSTLENWMSFAISRLDLKDK